MPENTPAIAESTSTSPFDAIKHIDEHGNEHWTGRELMPLLGYDKWQRFADVIDRAKAAARNSGTPNVDSQFSQVDQVTGAGNLGEQKRVDYRLTRYACYLVAMNGDPRKPEIAAAQTYFAVRTREAETAATAPRSQIDVLRLALDQIEAAQHTAQRAEATAVETSARLDAIEGRHEWFAALGWARLNGFNASHHSLNLLGQAASRIGRAHHITPNRVQHALYGEVNQWPRWIWDTAADELKWTAP